MLNLFSLKNVIFVSILGSGILAPVIATSPLVRELQYWSSYYDVSPLKVGIKDLNNVEIYDGESIPDFLKRALMNTEAQNVFIEAFVQELAKKCFLSQPEEMIKKRINEWEELHEKQFKEAWEKKKPKNPQRDFWDDHWGSKKSMHSFGLSYKSHEFMKSFLTEVGKYDFRIGGENQWKWGKSDKDQQEDITKFFLKKEFYINSNEMEKQDKWKQIGFYPTKDSKYNIPSLREVLWGKYDFLNWSYKKWFEETLPVYFWLFSWDYKSDATKSDLEKIYDFDKLKENFPKNANYAFPLFSQETQEKFQEFLKKSKGDQSGQNQNDLDLEKTLKKEYVPVWTSERKTNGMIISSLLSSDKHSLETTLASNYLIGKYLKTRDFKTVGQDVKTVNELKDLEKNGEKQAKDIIISKFLGKDKENQIKFNTSILKEQTTKQVNNGNLDQIYDAGETGEGWLFFRDLKGVHAMKIDGFNIWAKKESEDNLEELFKWFSFRNLQNTWHEKSSIDYEKTISTEDWFWKFKEYLNSNFDNLLIKYLISNSNNYKSSLFSSLKENDEIKQYNDFLTKLIELKEGQKKYEKTINLRRKIIEKYTNREWKEIKISKNAKNDPIAKNGLTSSFPYSVNIDKNESENSMRFPDQEKIFKFLLKNETSQSKEYLDSITKYYESLKKLIENKKDELKIRNENFDFQNSQRIFIKNPIFDFLLDKIFGNKDFVNYLVKERKLLQDNLFDNELFNKNKEKKWKEILKNIFKFDGQFNKNIIQTSNNNISPNDTKIKDDLFYSLMKKYLLRSFLFKNGNNYFNFLIEFPEFIDSNETQNDSTNKDLSTLKLFNIWRKDNLTNFHEKNSLLNFLITLDYITKDKFENLTKSMKNILHNKNKYHYLSFQINDEKDKEKKYTNPFLMTKNETNGNKNFFESREKMNKWIKSHWKKVEKIKNLKISDEENKEKQEDNKKFLFDLSLEKNSDSNPFEEDNLFNFSSLEELIKYINNISDNYKLKELINKLSKITDKISPSFYDINVIYYSDEKSGKSLKKKLFLEEEKKKALIYQLKNKNESLYPSKNFETNKIEEIFNKTDKSPENKDNQNSEIDKKIFERKTKQVGDKYFIQISESDFSSFEKIEKMIKEVGEKIFFELLLVITDNYEIKENAKNYFSKNTGDLGSHDAKFRNHLDEGYLI